MFIKIIFFFSFLLIVFVYGGYKFILEVCSKFKNKNSKIHEKKINHDIYISIYIICKDEQEKIFNRLENIYATTYNKQFIETIVISDGSTDRTISEVKRFKNKYKEYDIVIHELDRNYGKYYGQNLVAKIAKHEILISTDADTIFKEDFIESIIPFFNQKEVAVVGGTKVHLNQDSSISQSHERYQDMEYKIRFNQDILGVMCKTDGPCTAYRRHIWEEIEEFEDVDQVVCLLAKNKGLISRHCMKAICYERSGETAKKEFKTRSRMTRKALLSTFKRWPIKNIFSSPLFTLNLYSHKILRFFSPLYFLLFIITFPMVFHLDIYIYVFFILTIITVTFIVEHLFNKTFLFGLIYSLIIANLGFAHGIYKWTIGDKSGKYASTHKGN